MPCAGYKYTLSCCALIKNEQKYLKEWLDHYINQGVEHFYLIDNGSTDNTLNIIKQYNNITLFKDNRKHPFEQELMLNDNLLPIIKESKWSIIVDSDELMKGQHNYTIKSYIESEHCDNISCIYVLWKMFIGKNNDITRMTDMKTRFNYDFLNDDTIHKNPHVRENMKYFLMFGKSIFRTRNIKKVRVHKQPTRGPLFDNFHRQDVIFPDTLINTCSHINETTLGTANIILNHYFIKTPKAYENRMKKAKNKERGWNCPGWDYTGFVKELYNLDEKYLIEEP